MLVGKAEVERYVTRNVKRFPMPEIVVQKAW
jgi:hypothetical protein